MGVDKSDVLKKMREAEAIYVLMSDCTRMPFVVCDPETYDDEVILFDSEEEAKKQADMLEGDLELKEKEVYDLKHELIVSDSKAETATKELDEALEKIKNLEKEIVKLQTELEK